LTKDDDFMSQLQRWRESMEHFNSRHPVALVVEDDTDQRLLLATLLEESEMRVVECESAEAAMCLLDRIGDDVRLLFADVQLAGVMSGADLAAEAKQRFPNMRVVVTSGQFRPERLPPDAKFMPKPWRALDVLREAERSLAA
jgi:DNA-binding NtrC family response regulator